MYTHNQTIEIYRNLKSITGKAEYIAEEAIKNDLGEDAFNALRKCGFIEYCGTINGRRMYAI